MRGLFLLITLLVASGCGSSPGVVDMRGDVITEENRRDLTIEITQGANMRPSTVALSGYVRARSLGTAIVGANVSVEGTQRGVSTDENGFFILYSLLEEQTLTFSYVGYRTVSKSVRDLMETAGE